MLLAWTSSGLPSRDKKGSHSCSARRRTTSAASSIAATSTSAPARREYSNGFVVDGVNNTWAEMGEPRQNFAMDAIQEFKVSTSTYKAEYGLATGGLVAVVTKSGTNQFHGSGPAVLPRRVDHREGILPDDEAGLPPLSVRRHDRRADREGQDALLLRLRGDAGETVPHGQRQAACGRSTRARSSAIRRAGPTTRRSITSWRTARACSSATAPRTSTGRSSPPAGATTPSASFDFAVPRKSAVLGHTWVINSRALNDVRFQYAYAKYEVSPPYSHGDWEPADFTARLPLCTPVFTYPSITVGRLRQRADGPGVALAVQGRLLVPDARAGAARTSGRWASTSASVPFEGDMHEFAARQLDVPEGRASTTPNDPTTYPTQYTNSLPTYANIPTKTFAGYIQDDWQARERPDVEPRAALRPAERLVQRGHARTCSRAFEDKLGRDGIVPDRRLGRDAAEVGPRRLQQLRAARRHGVGSAEQRRDEPPRRLRDVLRQHAHAAELRRADVAAGASRSSSTARRSRIRSAASRATRSSRTAPPNITVHVERHGEPVRAPVQRRRQPDR